MASFEVLEPDTLQEALALLDREDPAVRPIGGGTALMLMMKAQLFKPARLVSLRRLNGSFSGIDVNADGSAFRIGAMTTFTALEHSPAIVRAFPVIAHTMTTLANVRVRNVATVGGNLAHADPHLDLPPVWIALGATVRVAGPGGERVIPVEDIAAGYYETTLANDELIGGIEVPVRPGWRARYAKVTTRAAHDWPALGLAVAVQFQDRLVADLRLVLSAAVDRPMRLSGAEAVLCGTELDDAVLGRACEVAATEADIDSDERGSADYKRHLLRVHLGRVMTALAAEREAR